MGSGSTPSRSIKSHSVRENGPQRTLSMPARPKPLPTRVIVRYQPTLRLPDESDVFM